jgi:tetratricopeptide (TPR) repeat protein
LAICAVLLNGPDYPYMGVLPPYYNYTCFVEAAAFCAALAAFLRKDGPRGLRRWLLGAAAATALLEVSWAHSRGALVSAAVGTGLFAFRHVPRRWLRPAAFAIFFALAGGLALTTWAKIDYAKAFKRPQIWQAAVRCALDHPVLGVGPGQFANAFQKHNFPAGYGVGNFRARAEHAHSEVMEALAEFGVPGLCFLLAAVWVLLRPPSPESSTWTREAGLAAFAGMSCQCLIDNMLQLPALGLLYFSALAVARAPAPSGPEGPQSPAALPVWRSLAAAALLLAVVAWVPGRLVQDWQAAAGRTADPERRLALLLRAVRVAPADPYLRESLYGAWLAQKPPRADEALEQMSQAERLSPFNAVYPVAQAGLRRNAGEWPQVLALASRAVVLEPDYLQARLLRAEALLELGRRDEARGELSEVDCRKAALGTRLNSGSGYDAFIMGFDRTRYEGLVRRAAVR